jgi:hypothetical protein
MIACAFLIIPPLMYHRNAKLKSHYYLGFSENIIDFKTDKIDSQLQWSLYEKALANKNTYLLYYGNDTFTIIPKRVFPSAEILQEFESLMRSKITHIKQL